ncbi:hypothetical protein AVEN_201670-1 [Araneus ventricosus]|uniref:Uncharacterized protein n=1 Tax=Araneus ventricosus TaxID=182803 RepID=A0A4Y2QHV7_ARAVE|nr:hypothetical protein AVEN_201670-1 [Araneus ventricosus]
MLPFARKEELRVVAEEIGESVTQEMKISDLRKIIMGSKSYKNDPESVENFMSSIVKDRKRKEEHRDKFELENKLEFEKIKLEKAKLEAQLALEKAKMDKEVELDRISLEKAKIRKLSQEVSNSTVSTSVESELLGQCRNARKLSENYVLCVPGVSSNMEMKTSRITNEIRADPLTIPEEEMGFRGHCPVDSYPDKLTAWVPPKKRESKRRNVRQVYLSSLDSVFVEEKVSVSVGLSPHRVFVSAVGHVVELRKGSSRNAAMLKTGVNFGDLWSVERTVMKVSGSGWSSEEVFFLWSWRSVRWTVCGILMRAENAMRHLSWRH